MRKKFEIKLTYVFVVSLCSVKYFPEKEKYIRVSEIDSRSQNSMHCRGYIRIIVETREMET